MCGAAVVAPLAGLATSLFAGGSGGSRGVQSHKPQDIEMTPQLPDPAAEEPTFGVDNSNSGAAQAGKGKSALVIKRNPGVSVAGGGSNGSGVNVTGR